MSALQRFTVCKGESNMLQRTAKEVKVGWVPEETHSANGRRKAGHFTGKSKKTSQRRWPLRRNFQTGSLLPALQPLGFFTVTLRTQMHGASHVT